MMDLLATEVFTIERKASGNTYDDDGYPVQGSASPLITAQGSIQPAPSEALAVLSEGDRKRSPKNIWSRTEMKLGDTITQASTGERFEVMDVSNWQQAGMMPQHYRALALRSEPA